MKSCGRLVPFVVWSSPQYIPQSLELIVRETLHWVPSNSGVLVIREASETQSPAFKRQCGRRVALIWRDESNATAAPTQPNKFFHVATTLQSSSLLGPRPPRLCCTCCWTLALLLALLRRFTCHLNAGTAVVSGVWFAAGTSIHGDDDPLRRELGALLFLLRTRL